MHSLDIAGKNNAMFFVEEDSVSALAAAIDLIKSDFDRSDGRPLIVSPLAPDATLPVAEATAIDFPVLSDPGAAMITAIVGGKPSKPYAAAVFDRNGRLMAAGIDEAFAVLVARPRKCAAHNLAFTNPV